MRVAVCCKGVPVDTQVESVQIVDGDLHFKGTDLYMNEFDAYALEAADALKNSHGAETFALTLGPLRAQEVLYVASAKGVDHVLRIEGGTSRPELIASGLIPALKEIGPQLVLAGVQSEDWMGGEVGIYLAQALEMSLAYAVIEILDVQETHILIKKEIGGGRKAKVKLTLPAVLCVQSGIQPLRYLSMMKLKKARDIPIRLWGNVNPEDARQKISGMAIYHIREASVPSREGHAEMITGDRAERAEKLIDIISKAV